MQIHELTRPRKVNEASVAGALGGAGAVLGGIATQVGKQLMTKALGADVTPQYGPAQSREQGFASMVNSPAAKTLATSMQTAWQQTAQNFMANGKDAKGNPPVSLDKVTQPNITTLKANLEDLVNKMIGRGGTNYKTLANNIANPTQKLMAEKIVAAIDKSVDAIYTATLQNTDPGVTANLFTQLVGLGILPAQNILAYDSNSGGAIRMSLAATKLADSLRLDDGDIVKIRQVIKKPGGDQFATAILDKKTPATTASPLIKQFGQLTKQTDAELGSMLASAQNAANDAAWNEIFGLRA